VVGRNIRSGRGEIDLLVRWPGLLVAVEVKTRAGADPRTAYTDDKSRAVRQAARLLRPRPRRLDLIAVELGRQAVDIRWVPGVV
jgi:Holliday junction resolvase-like predicted endonuclease